MATVKVNWNFTCRKCSQYVKANKPGHMGFCPIHDKRVAKDHSCRQNPLHDAFLLYMFGMPIEQAIKLAENRVGKSSVEVGA